MKHRSSLGLQAGLYNMATHNNVQLQKCESACVGFSKNYLATSYQTCALTDGPGQG